MKKLISWTALVMTLVLLFGMIVPASAATGGSWRINGRTGSYLTKAEKKVFDQAVKELTGVTYTPVFTLATQVAAGTHYAFFCKAVSVTASPRTSWEILIVSENTKGKCKILKVNSFNYKKIRTRKSAYLAGGDDGGWVCNNKKVKSSGVPSAAKKALRKATEDYEGLSLTPLVLLGSQVVAGTNYKYLCLGTASDQNATTCLYEVVVCEDTKGGCTITDCNIIDLPGYLKY